MKHFFAKTLLLLLLYVSVYKTTQSQCVNASINWDYLDYLDPTFVTLAQSQSQRFSIGTQYATITQNYTAANIIGENTVHTGETGSYGVGSDVQFFGNGTILFSFLNAVSNVRFSLYDVDYNQRVTVTALNGGTPVNVTMARVSGTVLTIAGSGTPTASATAGATSAVALTSSDGTVNVDIAGPITSFLITITQTGTRTTGSPSSQEDGAFWLSDLQVCSVGSFSANYRAVAQPITGMPSYVITVRNNEVYYVDPATGNARLLFTDPGHTNLNSLAYDPVNKKLYYSYSLTSSPATDYALRVYDYETDTYGIIVNDIRTLGVILHENGIESGGASFYDGSLYLGIEGNGTGYVTGRESRIWKIDFNSSQIPTVASQVYGLDALNHDWGDLGVTNGVLHDFDADAGNENVYSVNLLTRSVNVINTPTAKPRQMSIDWQENIFSVGGTATTSSTGSIAAYNVSAGTEGSQVILNYNGSNVSGSWGDGAEAFKPKTDYGDAPATFDPSLVPATHDKDPRIRLGLTHDIEWLKTASANATADGSDEDGITSSMSIGTGVTSFSFNVSVFNNTGQQATLIGWIDLNNDGIFQSSEGVSYNVNSNSLQQSVTIGWSNVLVSATVGSTVFLRLRLTSQSNGMTTSSTTGYFKDGEVEDYPVSVSAVLPGSLNFNVKKLDEKSTEINWESETNTDISTLELQRSADAISWSTVYTTSNSEKYNYSYIDKNPSVPVSYYRILTLSKSNNRQFSKTEKVEFKQIQNISIAPNPASNFAKLNLVSLFQSRAMIQVIDINGKEYCRQFVNLIQGINQINLNEVSTLPNGLFYVKISINNYNIYTHKLLISK